MIIVQLKGGLGNQLFQYAAALSLAHHHNTGVKVDTRLLNQHDAQIGTFRGFDLQHIRLEPSVAGEADIAAVTPQNVAARIADRLKPPYRRQVYREASFGFDPHFFQAGKNIYLKGYRQSEQYFAPIAATIHQGFQMKAAAVAGVQEAEKQLGAPDSVSIHIRRGDYANKAVQDYHGMLDEAYYQRAIDYFESRIPGCRFYIFSDAPAWVQDKLAFNAPVQVVSGKLSGNHLEDFHLISRCRHHVIANSTFSWWAAWLNPHPGKIVVAPERWFNKAGHDTRDLLPADWVKL